MRWRMQALECAGKERALVCAGKEWAGADVH